MKEIPVDTDVTADSDMETKIDQFIGTLDEYDPDNVAAIGSVVVLKNKPDDRGIGLRFRAISNTLDGFDDPSDVLSSIDTYNDAVEAISFDQTDDPIASLFGL